MPAVRSALRRGGLVLGVAAIGLALTAVAYLWWGTTSGALLAVVGVLCTIFALGWLYETRRPFRFMSVPLTVGVLAVLVVYAVSVIAARDIAMTLVGVDTEAVVERTWTTQGRGSETHHCTLRRKDGTPIPHELATNCEGHERGETVPVVLDPEGRFAPLGGQKADLPTVGDTQVAVAAGLVLLVAIVIGSAPVRPRGRRPRS